MRRWAAAAVVLAAVAAGLFLTLPGLGSPPLDDPGEGQHAEIAREAWLDGDPFTLRLGGVRYYDKPPLLYWLASGAFAMWGPSPWSARLPSVLGAAAAVAATALTGARLLGPRAGLLAGLALLGSPLFFAFARYVRPETLFAAAIQWGLTGLLLADQSPRRAGAWTLLGAAALGLASLAKDPLGLAGPLLAVAIARALAGRIRPVRAWLPPVAVVVMLVVGFGWWAVAATRNPGFLWYSAVDNHLLNVARQRVYPDEDIPLGAQEFLAVTALGAFPWVGPAALAMIALWRRRPWRDPAEGPWLALGLWAAGLIGVMTLSPFRLPHYGLPAYPALALLAARWWHDRGRAAIPSRAPAAVHALTLAVAAAAMAAALLAGGPAFERTVLQATDATARKGTPVAHPRWDDLVPLLGRTGLVLAAGAGALGVMAVARRSWGAAGITAVTMLAVMPAVGSGLALVASSRAVAPMAETIRARWRPGDLLVHEGPLERSAALEFHSGVRPLLLDARRSVLGVGSALPEARDAFWDGDRLRREWTGPRRILLLTPRPAGQSVVVTLPPDRVHLVAEGQGRWLWSNASAGGSDGADRR